MPTLGGQPCKNYIAGACPARNDKGASGKATSAANSLPGTVCRCGGANARLRRAIPARAGRRAQRRGTGSGYLQIARPRPARAYPFLERTPGQHGFDRHYCITDYPRQPHGYRGKRRLANGVCRDLCQWRRCFLHKIINVYGTSGTRCTKRFSCREFV